MFAPMLRLVKHCLYYW